MIADKMRYVGESLSNVKVLGDRYQYYSEINVGGDSGDDDDENDG